MKKCMDKLLCWVMICLPALSWAAGERIDIGRFSQGDLNGWQSKAIVGETRRLVRAGIGVLCALIAALPLQDSIAR